MNKEEFADSILDLARKCIDWHEARASGGVTVSSETSGLRIGSAHTIRRLAIAGGLWDEQWSPPSDAVQWDCPDCGGGYWLTAAEAARGCPADHPELCGATLVKR